MGVSSRPYFTGIALSFISTTNFYYLVKEMEYDTTNNKKQTI